MSHEIRSLTALRAIAAALVFFFHFAPPEYPWLANNPLEALIIEGHIGVPIFFALSGFLITLRYLPTLRRGGGFSTKEYVVKRVARLMPLYYFLLIPTLILRETFTEHAQFLPVYFTMTQGFFVGLRFQGITTAWTLTHELAFYVLAPFILLLIVWLAERWQALPVRLLWAGAILLLITLALYGIGLLVPPWSQATGVAEYGGFLASFRHVRMYSIFGRMFDFAAGVFAALVYLWYGKRFWVHRASGIFADGLIVLACAAIFHLVYLANGAGGFVPSWDDYYNYGVAFMGAIIIFALTSPHSLIARAVSIPPLVYGGRISYALYLLHKTPMVLWLLTQFPLARTFAGLTFFYLVTSVASALLYEWVEKPGQRWVVRLAGLERRSLPAVPPVVLDSAPGERSAGD